MSHAAPAEQGSTKGTVSSRVVVSRDYVGTEPIFYTDRNGHVQTAAELGYLLPLEPALCERYLAQALIGDFTDQTLTPFEGIRRLPAGHTLTVDGEGRARTHRWWSPPTIDEGLVRADPRELAEELHRLLNEAVARCMTSGPVAVEITGGLDSSAIAGLAAGRTAKPLPAYTFASAQEYLEREHSFLTAVIRHSDLDHHISLGHAADTELRSPQWPPPHPTRLPGARLEAYCRAADHGAKVLLSGWGGDQVASYAAPGAAVEHLRGGRLVQSARGIREAARFSGSRASTELLSVVRQRPQMRRTVRRGQVAIRAMAAMADPAFIARTDLGRASSPSARTSDEHRLRWFTDGHLQRRMELYAWDMQRTGLRYRYPLLDRCLVEWCLRVPAHRWWDRGIHRSLFRNALRDVVPERVLQRPRKSEPNPAQEQLAEEQRRIKLQQLTEASQHPLVRQFLPRLCPERHAELDLRRRNHLTLVLEFLMSPELTHLH